MDPEDKKPKTEDEATEENKSEVKSSPEAKDSKKKFSVPFKFVTRDLKLKLKEAAISSALGAAVTQGGILLVGFGTGGPLAGSLAAVYQAGIGNVAAGSAFSTIQSVAMKHGLLIIPYPVLIGAGVGIGAYMAVKYYQKL